jgi:DNA-binding NarL/FixJ family response regulator
MAPIRILLADDHNVVRAGIRALLEQQPDLTIVGEAGDGTEALRLAQELQPDILLLDMEMPGLDSIEVARRLKAEGNPVRVIALSAYDDKSYILNLLATGAAGYLIKEEAPQALVEAVRGVSQGKKGWLSQRVAAQVTTWMREGENPAIDLTDRERQVLELVVTGKTNREIGAALGISEKTVEKHLASVFSKLGVASRVEAAVRAVQEGLVD